MMKFKIESKPNPLGQFDNIKQLKTLLKPIKADEGGKFLDTLITHYKTLYSSISKDYNSSDLDYIDFKCEVFFNIPLSSVAWIGNKGGHRFLSEVNKNGNGATFEDKKDLGVFLQSLPSIPNIIKPIKLELSQKIGDTKSRFVYEVIG